MRYVGGKYRVAREISELIFAHATYAGTQKTLYEPFVGGGNMAARLGWRFEEAHYSDAHGPVTDLWRHVLIEHDGAPVGLPLVVSREEYERAKNCTRACPVRGFIGFAAAYSGKWFGSYVPVTTDTKGTKRDTVGETWRSIHKWAPKMLAQNKTTVTHQTYDALNPEEIRGATVYCDPPYAGVTGYTTGAFDHQAFWDWARVMSTHNSVFVSEYHAPEDFVPVWKKTVHSTLNDKTNVSPRVERLFVHQGALDRLGFTPDGASTLSADKGRTTQKVE